MPLTEERKYQNRIAKRKYKHGNWRQTVVDCACMCIVCHVVDGLEFHEPFQEDKIGWGMFQQRVLLCHDCHTEEHHTLFHGDRYIKVSHLSADVSKEMTRHGGYAQWIKDFELQDTFGRFLVYA